MLSVNSWDESLEFVQKGRERLRAKLERPLFCPFFGLFFSFAACSILLYVRIILYVPTNFFFFYPHSLYFGALFRMFLFFMVR